MGLSHTSSAPRLRRVAGTAAGFAMAAMIMCAGQPAFAAGHHQPTTQHSSSHATGQAGKSKSAHSKSAQTKSAKRHEDGNTERARSADCPGHGSHDGKSHPGKSQSEKSKHDKAAREKAARERAAQRAAEQARKAAEQKAAAEKAAAEKAAAEQQAAQQRAAQIQAAEVLKATHALHLAHQQAVQLKTAQLQATAAAVKAVNAAHASAVHLAALGTPVSITGTQQVVDLTTLAPSPSGPQNAQNAPTQNSSQAPAGAARQPKAEPAHRSKPIAAPRPIADDPILAIPTMIVTAGLSVGAAPEILLALVLFSGLGLVVIGTYRRKTSRVS